MNKITHLLLLFISATSGFGQDNSVKYILNHTLDSDKIEIIIEFDGMSSNTASLVIPRSGPGTYDLTNYLAFVSDVKGFTESNKILDGQTSMGSYFLFNEKDEVLTRVSYQVDVKKMETDLLGGFASSKLRENYLGILGYSVFGFMADQQEKPIVLEINTADDWPIFSTLRPALERKTGSDSYRLDNFSLLADAQFLLGSNVQISRVEGVKIPLFVAAYAETSIDLEEIGRRGQISLTGLADFFGYVPMPHYTMCYEFLEPLSDQHFYGFSMEHLNSMTASLNVSQAIAGYDPKARIGGIVHHMGHSWVPLRSYGVGYRPFEWQTAPLIETIWLNEGFTWYISYYYVLDNKDIISFFQRTIDNAPEYIKRKSLKELSLLGSTQYSLDFNIGRNLFSRGALLAHDLDKQILEKTDGKKSFKDVMLGLLKWTEKNQRAFEYDEIASIISDAVGVDISDTWSQWQKPMR